jgi:hypothetical protein
MSRIYSVEDLRVESLIVIPENPPAISVSASGWVPTSGWTHPELAPWMYISPPSDGVLDLDFVATAPTGIVLQVFSKIGTVKTFPIPNWVVGVRVHTSTNDMQATIGGAKNPSHASLMGEGLPLPWPFPWWAPKSKRQ